MDVAYSAWLEALVATSRLSGPAARSAFYRSAQRGDFVRVVAGVYLPAAVWRGMDSDARYLARICAVDHVAPRKLAFSHLSAAALWRLPMVNSWPTAVHASGGGASQTRGATRHHADGPAFTSTLIDGLNVTPLARTLIDVSRTQLASVAVAMVDFALDKMTTIDALQSEADKRQSSRGGNKCAFVLEFADALSGSPGESLSRLGMHLLGLPAPILQHEFRDREGRIIPDFWWPELGLAGEFDGYGKYLRKPLLKGQTTAQAVLAEKRREDRLRALGPRVVRWDWHVARSLPLLDRTLRDAGLR